MEIKKITPNEKQKECIETLEGPVMVLAGPGTGKTFTVIERIKYMLEKNILPEKILCLTFSEAAASEMRQRLLKKMGIEASGVDVYTYHAFCNEIIKENPDEFNLPANFSLISETIARELMKETVDEAKLVAFVPPRADKYNYVPKFINYVQKLKSLRMDKETYLSYINSNPDLMPKQKEIEKKIFKNVFIDFSDMINFVIDKFEDDKGFLSYISNKYDYFLVDEYQDTNALQ